MSELTKQAAYIKGLFDGLKLDENKDETTIISAIVDFLGKAADEIEMLDEEQGFIADELDDIEDVIDILAEEISGDEYDDDDMDSYQIKCEKCGNDVIFSGDDIDDMIEGSFACPECGEIIELDLSEMEDECGCGCNHDHE